MKAIYSRKNSSFTHQIKYLFIGTSVIIFDENLIYLPLPSPTDSLKL